jgi:hypothetical protein
MADNNKVLINLTTGLEDGARSSSRPGRPEIGRLPNRPRGPRPEPSPATTLLEAPKAS